MGGGTNELYVERVQGGGGKMCALTEGGKRDDDDWGFPVERGGRGFRAPATHSGGCFRRIEYL